MEVTLNHPGFAWDRSFLLRLMTYILAYASLASAMIGLSPDRIGIPIWPAAGVALAAVIQLGNRAWLVPLLGGIWAAHVRHVPLVFALLSGAGAMAEALFCAWLLRRWLKFNTSFAALDDVWKLAVAVIVSAALWSNTDFAVYALSDIGPWSFPHSWVDWWTANALGMLLVSPMLLAWNEKPALFSASFASRVLPYVAIMTALIALTDLFGMTQVHEPLRLLVLLPPLVWMAMRFSLRDAMISVCLVAAVAITAAAYGYGPFPVKSNPDMHHLALFIWVICLVVLPASVAVSAHRRLLSELAESGARLSSLVETITDFILFIDRQGCWQVANQAGINLFQLHGRSWQGKTGRELAECVPERRAVFEDCVDIIEQKGRQYDKYVQTEEREISLDGEVRVIELQRISCLAPDGGNAGVVVVGRDITERKRAQDDLEKSRIVYKERTQVLQTVLDALPSQVGLLDRDGNVVNTNRTWDRFCEESCKVIPFPAQLSKSYPKLCHKIIGNSEKALEGAAAVLRGDAMQFVCEYQVEMDRQQSWFRLAVVPIIEKEKVQGAVVMVNDITQYRKSEELLHQREQQFRALVDHSPDIVLRLDITGRILFWNASFKRHLQRDMRCITGQEVDEVWMVEQRRGGWKKSIDSLVYGHSEFEELDLFYKQKEDGQEGRIFQAYLVPEYSKGAREVRSILVVARDITASREAAEQLNQSRQQLRELAAEAEVVREQEKKEIARELHDELGQLLNALRIDIGLLKMQHGQAVPALAASADGMLETLNRAVRSTRMAVAHLRPAVLDQGLVSALEWQCGEFTKRYSIPCTIKIRGNVTLTGLDEGAAIAIFRIVQESLTNVAKHANASMVSLYLIVLRNCLRVTVRDNGCGFSPRERQAGRQSYGLLGMEERAIAQDGKLCVKSVPGTGTRIVLDVPMQLTTRGEHD